MAENNCRCPSCNHEFFTSLIDGKQACPNCGKEFSALQLRKYYSVFHDKSVEREDVHGKKYFQYEDYLLKGSHYLEKEQYDLAQDVYGQAIKANPEDYRGYMGMVASCTKNYTDLQDETHKQYLQKAISVADEAGKASISSIYKVYNMKATMDEGEYETYLEERQKDYKARVKKAIVGLAKYNEANEKSYKRDKIFFIVLASAGVIMCVLGGIFGIILLALLGLLSVVAMYAPIISIKKHRFCLNVYEFLVGLFNILKNMQLTRAQTDECLDLMAAVLLSIKEGDPQTFVEDKIVALVQFVEDHDKGVALQYVKADKLTKKYYK